MNHEERARIIRRIGEVIEHARTFWIFCHVNPDGDAMGSCLATYGVLEALKKRPRIFVTDPLPRMFLDLPHAGQVTVANKLPPAPPDAIIVADTGAFDRIGRNYVQQLTEMGIGPLADKPYTLCELINFDHHLSNDRFGTINLIDPSVGACGELFFETFRQLEYPISLDVAINLYATILTDTGRFSYGNTSSASFNVASELIKVGVDPFDVVNRVYNTKTISQMSLYALILSTVEPNQELGYFTCYVTRDMLDKTGCMMTDTEGIVDIIKSVYGFRACFFLKEEEEELVKVSSRSNGLLNCNEFSQRFGGGGHPAAAGFPMNHRLNEALKVLEVQFRSYLTEKGLNGGSLGEPF